MPFIYILHFDTALAHAEHYTGCTSNLRQRLTAHARGNGSLLTRELHKQGIGWQLGGLAECTINRMRSLERGLKDQHNVSRYCQICSPTKQLAYTRTKPYDIGLMPWAKSAALHTAEELLPATLQTAEEKHMPQIIALMRQDKDALGFIPAGGNQGLNVLLAQSRLVVATSPSGIVLGYLAFTTRPSGPDLRIKIHQCCVHDIHRFQGIGRELVRFAQGLPFTQLAAIDCTVREDLAANHFWQSIGFELTHRTIHETSGRGLAHYSNEKAIESCQHTSLKTIAPTNTTATENDRKSPTSPQK